MRYYCYGNKEGRIYDPTPEEIERAIDELMPIENDFFVLDSIEPINNCRMVQTIIDNEKNDDSPKLRYHVETQFTYCKEAPFAEGNFTQYKKYTTDVNEVKMLFRMFALGETPDVTGWEDITAEIIALRDK